MRFVLGWQGRAGAGRGVVPAQGTQPPGSLAERATLELRPRWEPWAQRGRVGFVG